MMKFLFRTIIAAAIFVSGFSVKLLASHVIGGEITYTCVAPNVYVINSKLYRDCTGATAPTSIILDLKPQNCAGGRSITAQNTGSPVIGNPYCSQIPLTCSTVRINHEEAKFSTTVTFTPAEAACPNWIISFTENARQQVANLVNPQGNFYCESFLKLGTGINNNSAIINPAAPSVEFVCVGQETRLSLTAYDADCDSLSYELVAPLSAANTPYTYNQISSLPAGYFPNPNPPMPYCNTCTPANPQFGYFPPGGPSATTFSPTYPIPSYNANWNAINPATGVPYQFVPAYQYFQLTQAGEIRFRPSVFFNTPPVQGNNQYAVVVKINEWRKVNGVITKVGFTRRDMLFIVADCNGNENPFISTASITPQQSPTDTIIRIQAGAQLNFQFTTADLSTDTLTIDSDVTTQLPGATFTQTSAAKPTGTIFWTAPATNGTCGIRYFYIRIKDNACPIKGKKVITIGVKVTNAGSTTGINEDLKTELNFTAYPNPFTETVTFRLESKNAAKEIKIFNLLGEEIDRIKIAGNEKEIAWHQASKFAAGIYVAKLITRNNAVQTLKFSKLQ